MKRTVLLLTAVAVLAALVLATPGGWQRAEPASASSGGPELRMEIVAGSGGFCNVNNECYAEAGSTFTLGIDVVTAPAAGYALVQTFVDFGIFDPAAGEDTYPPGSCNDGLDNGGDNRRDRFDEDCVTVHLTYKPLQDADLDGDTIITNSERGPAREIVWPDNRPLLAFRNERGPGLVGHAGLTRFRPPLWESTYTGRIVEIELSCPATPVQSPVALRLYGDPVGQNVGSLFAEPDGQTPRIPKVNSITVNCVSPQPFPGDTDGDGCADAREEGSDPALGGDRDFLNPWDFYDVSLPKDGSIDLFGDILPVMVHAGTAPGPPYDVNYDRGAWQGVNSWNDTLPPDGVIDEPNDIDGVFAQYGHSCT